MKPYDHKEIEKKWQDEWEKTAVYKTKETSDKPKCYVLDMFPYPSGEGLHVGHPKGYIATDIYSRFKQMSGFNILHPMGWDAFGLPAENYAIKNKVHPRVAVEKNVKRYKEQLSVIGFNYDWTREIDTTDPEYYKWTQWIFLKLFEKGLAYESHEPINWCPSCQTGLANEDLEGGKCERCGSVVEKKPMRQWVLKITDYADCLLEDLPALNWPESIKESQRNWIGKSEGAEIVFQLTDIPGQVDNKHSVTVFTTRPDTIFGATFLAVSADLAKKWLDVGWVASTEIQKYITDTITESVTRDFTEKEKTGIFSGIYAINPANQEKIPVWVVNYVLGDVGTGAIMAVPADDARDEEFATKFNLPIVKDYQKAGFEDFGKKVVRYKLRDWVFSRQRYWGEPIPVIHCEKCGVVAVPEKDLPVKLPEVEHYEPTGTGESPLANITDWVNTVCPKCGGPGKRETNTMPQWAGSSWYYLRYIDPKNNKALVDKAKEKYWSSVDFYVGGAEHATRHLIYARFWHKFLFDIGAVNYPEPFARLQHVGLILAEDGRKMSKRWGNVINPDEIINLYGADTLRLYEMFMGPFDQNVAWSTESIIGPRRFIERVWKLRSKIDFGLGNDREFDVLLNQTIKKVSEDIESFGFNTAISSLMILVNELEKQVKIDQESYLILLQLIAPFAPHFTEELWRELGNQNSIHLSEWPKVDESKLVSDTAKITVQVNSKVRAVVEMGRDLAEKEVLTQVLTDESVKKWVGDSQIKRVVFVPNKLINILI